MWNATLHSVLDPASPQGAELASLFNLFTIVCTIVWVLVLVALLMGLLGRARSVVPPRVPGPDEERGFGILVFVLAGLTAVTVLTLSGFSYGAQRRLYGEREGKVSMTLTGHQWWWNAQYSAEGDQPSFTTANELVVPAGEPITIRLDSADVIHSFWQPSLMGKLDLIPGRANTLHLAPVRPGVYRGQCAEFCGLQHAHMALVLEAKERPQYDEWRHAQAASANLNEDIAQGRDLFMSKGCASCHQIRGTDAGGRVGPDLTHVASRKTIAAGTLPFNPGALAAWISDPQKVKPGAQMPPVDLSPTDLNALVDFVGSLK